MPYTVNDTVLYMVNDYDDDYDKDKDTKIDAFYSGNSSSA